MTLRSPPSPRRQHPIAFPEGYVQGTRGRVSMGAVPVATLTPDELLSTTRAVRRRLDLTRPVPLELVRECIDVAVQAPTASNQQNWHFIVVADADRRAALGSIYARAFAVYREMPFAAGNLFQDDP